MNRSKHDNIINNPILSDIKKRVNQLKIETGLLTELRQIRNELLSNGAYHEKNLEEQLKKMEKLNVPNEELAMIIKSGDLSFKLSHTLMRKYETLLNYIEENYKFS